MAKKRGRRKKESHVGIDIGTRFIKALDVSSDGETQLLNAVHSAEIEPPCNASSIKYTLKSLLENFKPSTKNVTISLSAPSAMVRFINMPKMSIDDLRNSLKFEAEKYIPFSINDVLIDVVVLEEPSDGKGYMRVLLAAAKKDAVNSRIAMFEELGLTVSVIDIDFFACFNAFYNSSGKEVDGKNVALLNIGHTQTNVVMSKGNQPYFTRDIQIGGRDMLQAVSKELQIDNRQSETLVSDPKEKSAEVFEICKSVLNNLADELRLSFGYYENQSGGNIHNIYLSGGAVTLHGIDDFMQESLGIKPVIWDPFAKFKMGQEVDAKLIESDRARFAICAGLALRR
ncbi:MAG: type IV pilus assembly protein PilM [Candidatus Omnitrophica bacterium]|nr:type IV pilus assembly protein PilM [Candidatus Omnitrophota bacterium]